MIGQAATGEHEGGNTGGREGRLAQERAHGILLGIAAKAGDYAGVASSSASTAIRVTTPFAT